MRVAHLLQDPVPSSTAAGDDDDGGSAAAAAAASESDGTGSSTGLDPGPGGAEVAAGGNFDNDAAFRIVRRREIARALKISQQALSRHLSILKSADIVDYRKRGLYVSYRLQLKQSKEVQTVIRGL